MPDEFTPASRVLHAAMLSVAGLFVLLIAVIPAIITSPPLLAHAAIIRRTLTISNRTTINPDCSPRAYTLPLANAQLPGPPLILVRGDILEVVVRNELRDSFGMHWHGVRQRMTPFSDGVPWVSQVPIRGGGGERLYRMVMDEAGTYFYHAHSKAHANTVYGAIVVRDPMEEHGEVEDALVVLGDWFHADGGFDHLFDDNAELITPGSPAIAAPDVVLVNGRSVSNITPKGINTGCLGPAVIDVRRGTTTRLRIINAGGRVAYRLGIPHALNPRLVEADAGLVQEALVLAASGGLDVNPGQRYSVLVTVPADAAQPAAAIAVGMDGVANGTIGTFVLRFVDTGAIPEQGLVGASPFLDAAALDSVVSAIAMRDADRPLIETRLRALHPTTVPAPTRTLLLNVDALQGGSLFTVNGATFVPPFARGIPLLHSAYQGFGDRDVLTTRNVYGFQLGEVVDVIIQHAPGFCHIPHPWHAHGLRIQVLGTGPGTLSHKAYASVVANAASDIPMRDTVMVVSQPPSNAATQGPGCGWAVMRIRFDNPGIWHFHCHLIIHLGKGMAAVLAVGLDQLRAQVPTLPLNVQHMVLDTRPVQMHGGGGWWRDNSAVAREWWFGKTWVVWWSVLWMIMAVSGWV